MNFLDGMLLNFMFVLFPSLLYLFYIAYNQNLGKEENDLYLDLALLTSVYLIYHFHYLDSYLLLHIPLLIAYYKKRDIMILSFSILLIFLFFQRIPILLSFSIYSFCFLFYSFMKNTQYLKFLFFLPLLTFELSKNWFLSLFSFYTLSFFTFYFYQKGEQIIKFHMELKELKKEEQIHTSLFKITHEIKNPIAVCKGYLDMFDVNNFDHFKKYIPIIKEEIARTLLLLQDFLSLNHIQMEKDIMDINYLLEEVSEHFKPILKEKNVVLKLSLLDDEIDILGDYHRLSQVFINLIKNSVESMQNGGTLRIETKEKDHKIQIIIQDTGCGIPTDLLSKIQEPFFTTKKNGTGLGVSLSNEIIKGHNGTMEYQSVYGKGTTVITELPILA